MIQTHATILSGRDARATIKTKGEFEMRLKIDVPASAVFSVFIIEELSWLVLSDR
jgi:hypothetical protein